jgi:hypothetical protein
MRGEKVGSRKEEEGRRQRKSRECLALSRVSH